MRFGSTVENADVRPTGATPEKDVLAALRAATGGRHAAIDRAMPLSSSAPTLADYVEHLHLLRAWLPALHCALPHSQAAELARIDADLADSGLASSPPIVDLPSAPWPPSSMAYRWGVSYVIEGSRLGAAVLHRRLRHALRPHPLRYLQGDAETSTNRWSHFLRELRATVKTPSAIAEACQGACDSFDALLAITRERA